MASDNLRLLFELDVDSRSGTEGLLRFRKEIAATIESVRRAVTQPLKSLNTTPITAAAKASAAAQEAEQRRLNTAVQSLQRQRSAALIRAFKDEERAATASAREQERAAQQAARAQERAAQQASRSIANAFRSIGPGLQSLGRTLSIALTAPLTALGVVATKNAVEFDSLRRGLEVMAGSAGKASEQLKRLREIAKAPGIGFKEAIQGSIRLQAVGFSAESAERQLRLFANAIALTGGGKGELERVTVQLGQLAAKGKVVAQDLKPIIEAAPAVGQALLKAFGTVNSEDIQKLGLSTEQFFKKLDDALETLPRAAAGARNAFENFSDSVFIASTAIGEAILPPLTKLINTLEPLILDLADRFKSLSPEIQTVVIAVGALAAAAGPVLFVLGGLATAIAGVVSAVGTVAAAVAAIGLPAIAAIIAGIVIVVGEWATILGVLGLAWKTNFLNIQGLVSDAASAVQEAFARVRAVFEEVSARVLPTLLSISTKVVTTITTLWERYGATVVRVISSSFEVVIRTLEAFIRFFGNVVDLIAKLIDGDWRGAWQAFSRIIINAIDSIDLTKLFNNIERAFIKINKFLLTSALTLVKTATKLAEEFIATLVISLISGAPRVADALSTMLLLAIAQVLAGPIGGTFGRALVSQIIAAMRKAAKEGGPIFTTLGETAVPGTKEDVAGAGIFRPKKPPSPPGGSDKGADAETRRRIRLLELEAERAEAIARQRINAENIHFDERRTSLKDFTEFQIKEEEIVLEKKKAVFAAERAEAEKLGKGRDVALAEIRLKELKADIDFFDKRNQLLANQAREELEAAKSHRQALLDIQEQADAAEIARLEDLQRQGKVTAFDVANRQAEIEKAARARHRAELETQLKEADKNEQDREKLLDAIKKFDDESAESVRRNERLTRDAVQETANAYRDYALAIHEALDAAKEAARDAAAIALSRLSARVFLTPQQRIERQFALDKKALEAEKRASDLRIDNAEREAVEKSKKAGKFGEEELKIEKTFNDLRLAEQRRFRQQQKKLEEDKNADLERADPSSGRSLFGDTFADAAEATGSTLAGLAATAGSIFADLSAQAGNFATILVNVFSQLGEAVGTVVENFVKFGTAGIGFKKFAVDVIASVAKMAVVKSIFEFAEAAAAYALFWFTGNPKFAKSGSEHLAAGILYGLVGGVATGVGRAVAGNSQRDNAGTASRAVSGGEPTPNNRNFESGGQRPVETSLQAARDGSGGILGQLVSRIESLQQQNLDIQRQQMLVQGQTAQALTRIQSMRHGDALAIGTEENPAAVTRAVINQSNSDGEFNETMQRNLGFAR